MSNIRLQGNPSGTGTLTIASPNTNSDFTLNLPAGNGTVLVDGASQSPTFNTVTATNVATTNVTATSTTTTTLAVAGNNISAVNSLGFRNRIINGDMRIDQRNAGASVTFNNLALVFPVDRFCGFEDTDGVMTGQQDSSAPPGFTNSVRVTTTTADSSLGGTQFAIFRHNIEGTNFSDLGWGTANAQAVTLSFWTRSSLTGTFGGAVMNSAQNRVYPFSYSISAANTWEQKTITIPGDTTGTWLTNNGIGLQINFGLGVGSTYSGSAGSWSGTFAFAPTGAVSVIGTLNATWQITGVQLEAGSVATPFERRDYGRELMMCQRYYWKTSPNVYARFGMADCVGGTTADALIAMPVTMRATPAITTTGIAGTYAIYSRQNLVALTQVPTIDSVGSTPELVVISCTSSTGWTQGSAGQLLANANTGSFFGFSAEL